MGQLCPGPNTDRPSVYGTGIGARRESVAELNEETLAAIRAQLDDDALAEAWEQGRMLTIDEAVAFALGS